MKKLLTILFILFSCAAGAQSLHVNTTRFVGGDSTCGAMGNSLAISTRDGGILFFGSTACYSGGGNIPPFVDAAGAGNALIGKLDSNLNVSWVKVYGGTQGAYATCAVQTSDGGYAVLATTASGDVDVTGNHGTEDFWLIRLDSLGNLLWEQCYGSPYDEQPGSIALTPDNGFIFYGISNGSGDEVPTHYGSEFNYNWFVVKTDSAGNMQWGKTIGGSGGSSGEDGENYMGSIIAVNNAYYLVSSTGSTDHDCTDTSWHPGVNTNCDYYIFKLDTAGNILWDSSYGGSGTDIADQAIWDSRDSSIVINGSTTSDNYMITGNHGQSDMGVVKTDENGVFKWAKCLGSPNNESGNSICVSEYGYMAYGATDPGNIGEQDAWIFALNILGDTLSNKQFGGTAYEYSNSVFAYKNGYAAIGTTNSMSFTEGYNIGHLPGLIGETFISYLVTWPLGISNINTTNLQMALYPNPSNSMVRIILPSQSGILIILNSIGENIYCKAIQQNESININTAGWASGIYIAKWQGEDGIVLVKKFIKN